MQTNAAKTDLTQTLVDRARAMLPALRERAQQCEDECKVPDATIRGLLGRCARTLVNCSTEMRFTHRVSRRAALT